MPDSRITRVVMLLCAALVLFWHRPAPAAGGISLSQERQLGERFALLARSQMPLVRDARVGSFLTAIGERILSEIEDTRFSYRFFLVKQRSLNAFAVPGGFLYVNAGLLSRVDSVPEIAGVLAHEITHVHMHHMARQHEKTQILNYATLLGMVLGAVHPAIAAGAATVGAGTQLKYRREFEQEADLLGVGYMSRAGFDPGGMISFLGKIERQQRLNPSQVPPYFLSHPMTPDRIVQLSAKIKKQGMIGGDLPRTLVIDLERVQALIRTEIEPQSKLLARYRRVLEKGSDEGAGRHNLGLVYASIGQVDKAMPLLAGAVAAGRFHARTDLGIVLLQLGKPGEAAAELKQAVQEDAGDAVAKAALARAMLALDKPQEAIAILHAALALYPESDEAEYALARCYGMVGKKREQWTHLGQAFLLRGELERARSALRKARDLAAAGSADKRELEKKLELLAEVLSSGDS